MKSRVLYFCVTCAVIFFAIRVFSLKRRQIPSFPQSPPLAVELPPCSGDCGQLRCRQDITIKSSRFMRARTKFPMSAKCKEFGPAIVIHASPIRLKALRRYATGRSVHYALAIVSAAQGLSALANPSSPTNSKFNRWHCDPHARLWNLNFSLRREFRNVAGVRRGAYFPQ